MGLGLGGVIIGNWSMGLDAMTTSRQERSSEDSVGGKRSREGRNEERGNGGGRYFKREGLQRSGDSLLAVANLALR